MHHPLHHAAALFIFALTFGSSPSSSFPSSSSFSSQSHVVGINVAKLEKLFAGQKPPPVLDDAQLSALDTHPFEDKGDFSHKTSSVDGPPGGEHPLEMATNEATSSNPIPPGNLLFGVANQTSAADLSPSDHRLLGNQTSPSHHSLLDDPHLDESDQTSHHSPSDAHHFDEGSQASPSHHSPSDDHLFDVGNQTSTFAPSSDDHQLDEGDQISIDHSPSHHHHFDESDQTSSDHSPLDHHLFEADNQTSSFDHSPKDDHHFGESDQMSPSDHSPDDHLFEADNQTSTFAHSSDDHLFEADNQTSTFDRSSDDHLFDVGNQSTPSSLATPFVVSQSSTSDPPTPVSIGLAIPGFSPGVSSAPSSGCVCVEWWKCSSNVSEDAEGVPQEFPEPSKENFVATIDLRLTVHCPYMQICCDAPNVIIEELPLPPLHTPQCGRLNNNGVLFHVNGFTDNQAQFGQFPWMAALTTVRPRPDDPMSGYLGGGSLIHPGVIMTAAHKVYNRISEDLVVRLGEWDLSSSAEAIASQEIGVRRVSCHPKFSFDSLEFNVALLFLEREADLGITVDTICLPGDEEDVEGARCLSSGWGKDAFGQEGRYQEILKSVQLPLVRREACESALRTTRLGPSFLLGRTAVCAGGETGDLCTGDGGSPLVCPSSKDPQRYVQVGISAWGIGCGQRGIPGVYASVTDSMPWVRAEMRASMPLDVRRPTEK